MHCKIIVRYCFLTYILFVIACSEPEKPVTKEEAAQVAASLTDAMTRRNAGRFNELLDADALKKRIISQSQTKINSSMVEGAMKSMKSGQLGLQIVRSLGEKGTYELVKQYEKDKHQRLVFRLYNDQLNYHDFELIKKGDQVKVADIFIYTTGENLSSTLAQSLMFMNERNVTSTLGKDDIQKVQRIKNYINQSEFEKASSLFKTLPAVIREQKIYKIIYIQIASGLGNEKYLEALNRFQQEYPDAPNMYLLMLDAYFLKKDYKGALQCVNSLDSLIDKDLFLDYYRALIYKESEDNPNKMLCLERMHQNLPDFGAGTVELINAYVEDKQWDKAVPLTQQYRKSKNADIATLENLYLLHADFKEKMESAN